MRKLVRATVVAALALAVPQAVWAQDMAEVCAAVAAADIGDWAEYEITSPQGSGTIRMALIPEGAAPDEGQWIEMSFNMNGQSGVIQALVDDYPFESGDVMAVVMKAAGQPAMRIPDMMLDQARGQISMPVSSMADNCEGAENLGSESVSVPGGSFTAWKVQSTTPQGEGTFWVSGDVPFGLVKGEGAEGSMVLVGTGDDATSSITETPMDMPGAPGMGNQ